MSNRGRISLREQDQILSCGFKSGKRACVSYAVAEGCSDICELGRCYCVDLFAWCGSRSLIHMCLETKIGEWSWGRAGKWRAPAGCLREISLD